MTVLTTLRDRLSGSQPPPPAWVAGVTALSAMARLGLTPSRSSLLGR